MTKRVVEHDTGNPLRPAPVHYKQKQGGKTFYSNNPEQVILRDLADKAEVDGDEMPQKRDEKRQKEGVCLMQADNMQGNWHAIFEHSNHTGIPVYFGLRLKNNGQRDATITVRRVGYQSSGDWCGTMAYTDYYQQKFPLPVDHFDAVGNVNWHWELNGLVDYAPKPFTPETYILPPGKHFYVIGGTSADAYNNYNVGGTADQQVGIKADLQAVNGVADFCIDGENITGSMLVYSDPTAIDDPHPQGYTLREDLLGGHLFPHAEQYGGVSDGLAVVENAVIWRIGDATPPGRLPVSYVSEYAMDKNVVPYAKYDNRIERIEHAAEWTTNLNPQNYPGAVGSDIIGFTCVDEQGVTRRIDRFHADGAGHGANICNWMVAMRDSYTIENASNSPREVKIYQQSSGRGIGCVLVRDANDNIIKTYLLTHPFMLDSIEQARSEYRDRYVDNKDVWIPVVNGVKYSHAGETALAHTFAVPPLAAQTVTIEYVMLANSWGAVTHYVEVS
ncbi:MAG: hypothetical protein FWE06_02130 [Oscillospiraceae bacterium]|nr:hypothetical protein [Oscillospiraceae bacterium]